MNPALDRESRLDEVLADYLEKVEQGQIPDRRRILQDHPDLADDLAAFFKDQDRLGQMLTPPDGQPGKKPDPLAPPPSPGQRLGDYELQELVARGGMGLVYRARHVGLDRPVALKMILAGQFATAEQIQRFHLEAEAIAQLDHPNIVPIYDVGEDQGWHFFTMKFIEGGSLKIRPGDFQGRAGQRQAAQMLRTLALAMHHAHRRGVLHRDLKPGNILLDPQGTPIITDFGLAKRLYDHGSSLHSTPTGTAVGTPSYMAPEQALGPKNITTAVDIYSLGAILYEMLTGQPPFKAETPLATLLEAIDQKVPPPSTLRPDVHQDLETICLKCLDKDPSLRYGSALELADDLQRFWNGEPIQARATGLWERILRWSRREPALASVTFALVLVVLGGLGIITWQWQSVRASYAMEQKLLIETKQQRELAEKRFQQAKDAVDEFAKKLSEDRLANYPAFSPLRKELLEISLTFYHQFLEEKSQDPALRLQTANTHAQLGNLQATFLARAEALREYLLALAIFNELARENPGDFKIQKGLIQTLDRLGLLQLELGQENEGNATLDIAREAQDELIARFPQQLSLVNDKANAQRRWADFHFRQGRFSRAKALLTPTLQLLEDHARRFPNYRPNELDLAETYFSLGSLQVMAGEDKQGADLLKLSLELLEKILDRAPHFVAGQQLHAQILVALARQDLLQERLDDAHRKLDRARENQEKLTRLNPLDHHFQKDLALTLRHQGLLHAQEKEPDRAILSLRKAQKTLVDLHGLIPGSTLLQPDLAECFLDSGRVLLDQGKGEEALKDFEQARNWANRAVQTSADNPLFHETLGFAQVGRAQSLWKLDKIEAGRQAWTAAEKEFRTAFHMETTVPRFRRSLAACYQQWMEAETVRKNFTEVDRLKKLADEFGERGASAP